MNADAAFVTGKTHRVCQDYARADISNGQYAIVADGCSSSPDSDFGSRLLVKSVENFAIGTFGNNSLLHKQLPTTSSVFYDFAPLALRDAIAAQKVLSLGSQSLDATLLLACYREGRIGDTHDDTFLDKVIHVQVYGDGFVAARRRESGIIDAYRIEYPSGYPLYLSYSAHAERRARLLKELNNNPATLEGWVIETGLDASEPYLSHSDTDVLDDCHHLFFPIEKYDLVAIFSDGVNTFTDANGVSVAWQKVLTELMDVRSSKGEFVQRSMNWLVKECVRRKWSFADDISMAAINLCEIESK